MGTKFLTKPYHTNECILYYYYCMYMYMYMYVAHTHHYCSIILLGTATNCIGNTWSKLSDKINQDPLEKFFGRLHQHGRANQNPTVAEALKSTQTLRVVDSVWVDDLTGSNCRGRKRKSKFLDTEDRKPLPKQRRQPSM